MPINLKNKKVDGRNILLRQLGLPKWTRATVLSYISDPQILGFFHDACEAIGVTLITTIDDVTIAWADVWITDCFNETIPMQKLSEQCVVPVIPVSTNRAFSEFDPMKFEWNAFIFDKVDSFQMFEKLIRALENMRYAGDKRMLLQNVEKTFWSSK